MLILPGDRIIVMIRVKMFYVHVTQKRCEGIL